MLEQVSELARQAGQAIMQIYQQSAPIEVQEKLSLIHIWTLPTILLV